jgi:hypothetical protein
LKRAGIEARNIETMRKQRQADMERIDDLDISVAFQDVERLGGDPTGFVQDGQLTEDGKRFQEVWRTNLKSGMNEKEATQKALADVKSGRLSQGQRLFDQINKMTDDEFEDYQDTLADDDLVRDLDRDEYLKELKSEISGKSGELSTLDSSVNNKFRDQNLEKLKNAKNLAISQLRQLIEQDGDNPVSRAKAAEMARKTFQDDLNIKDIDNFDFGNDKIAREIKELLSFYDPKIIELNENIEKAKRRLSLPEKNYVPAFGASFGGGIVNKSTRRDRLKRAEKELEDYLESKR